MNETLLHCLQRMGGGNPKDWRRAVNNYGGFTLSNDYAPYWLCNYSTRGVVLCRRNGGDLTFTAQMCDAVAGKAENKQLALF